MTPTPIADMVEHMLAAGIPHDAIVLAVATAEMIAASSGEQLAKQIAAKKEKEAARGRARRAARPSADVRGRVDGAVSSRACSSSSNLEESKIGGGGECARERARDTHENKLILKEASAPAADPEEVAAEVEQVVKRSGVGHWPERSTPGWMRSTVVPQIVALLKAGVARNVILEAVRIAAENYTTGHPIGTFKWFLKPIMRAHEDAQRDHAEAIAQMNLPLVIKGGKGARHHGGHHARRPTDEEKFRADLAAKRLAEATNGNASDGVEPEAGIAVEAAENG